MKRAIAALAIIASAAFYVLSEPPTDDLIVSLGDVGEDELCCVFYDDLLEN